MTADMEYLQTTSGFVNPWHNRRYEDEASVCSKGKAYMPKNKGLPDERAPVCAVMAGLRFYDPGRITTRYGLFDAKG
jgi:hypothetical protein